MPFFTASHSRRNDWAERLALWAMAGSATGLAWSGARMSRSWQAGLTVLLLISAASLLWCGRGRLLGPVVYHEMVGAARRGRFFLVRCLFAFCLGVIILAFYYTQSNHFGLFPTESPADFVQSVFFLFLSVEFAAVFLLTPVFTAAAIAGEKENRTLEFLLATDLNSHEIIAAKLVARVAKLVVLLLIGVPVLSLLQLLGGIDPNQLAAAFATLFVTVCGLSALGILISVYSRSARTAVVLTYLAATAYIAGTGAIYLFITMVVPNVGLAPDLGNVLLPTSPPVTVDVVLQVALSGNPLVLAAQLSDALATGTALEQCLPWFLLRYALFHAFTVLVCLSWAAACLRAQGQAPFAGTQKAPPKMGNFTRWCWRLRIGNWPLFWKEVAVPDRALTQRMAKLLIAIPTFGALAFFLALLHNTDTIYPWAHTPRRNVELSGVTLAIALLTLIVVLAHAAGSVSGEREKQTLGILLSSPFSTRKILGAKWLASLMASRWLWALALLLWFEGLLFGVADLLTLAIVLLTWLVDATLFTSLGLLFSVYCRTSFKALMGALIAGGTISFGHWLLWIAYLPLILMLPDPSEISHKLFRLHVGLTPPAVLAWPLLPRDSSGSVSGEFEAIYLGNEPEFFDGIAFASPNSNDVDNLQLFMLVGLLISAFGSVVFWLLALARFGAPTRTDGGIRPEIEAAANLSEGEIRLRLAQVHNRHKWRSRLSIATVLLLPPTVFIAAYRYLDAKADHELRIAIAEIERDDPRWRLEQIEADRFTPPDEENSALCVLAASRLLPKSWEKITYPNGETTDLEELLHLPCEQQLDVHLLATLRAKLNQAKAALPIARKLADFRLGRFTINWTPYILDTAPGHLGDLRAIARLLQFDSLARAQEGDSDGAIHSTRALLNAGRALSDEPLLMSMVERVTIRSDFVSSLERALAQGEVSESSMAQLQALVEREIVEPLYYNSLRGTRALVDAGLRKMENEGPRLALLTLRIQQPGLFRFVPVSTATIKYGHSWSLVMTTRAMAVARRPMHEWLGYSATPEEDAKYQSVLPRMVTSDILIFICIEVHSQALLRCALVGLAAERYYRQHKIWPSNLNDLVPQFLAEVPHDPFHGKPLNFSRKDGKYVAHTIDWKENDNRKSSARYPYPSESGASFQLWDVDRRRHPPRNPEMGPPLPDKKQQ